MPPSWYQSPPAFSMPVAGETIPRQNPAVIRKSGLEIKNRCTKQPIFSTLPQQIPQPIPQHAFHHALTTRLALDDLHGDGLEQVRQWRRKRVLMRPEAAFPYVFAAEGAQHPPIKPPRSTYLRSTRPSSLHANSFCRISSHRHWRHTACASLQAAR